MGESSFKRFSHVKVTELFKIISESSGKHLIPSQVSKERGFDQNFTFKILGYDLTDRTIYHVIIKRLTKIGWVRNFTLLLANEGKIRTTTRNNTVYHFVFCEELVLGDPHNNNIVLVKHFAFPWIGHRVDKLRDWNSRVNEMVRAGVVNVFAYSYGVTGYSHSQIYQWVKCKL